MSQIRINYRDSALSAGQAGSISGGDRLPWVQTAMGSNYGPLRSIDWQLHVYGNAGRAIREACDKIGLPLHQFDWSQSTRKAGLKRDACYVIRPDGYIGLIIPTQNANELTSYLHSSGMSFRVDSPQLTQNV